MQLSRSTPRRSGLLVTQTKRRERRTIQNTSVCQNPIKPPYIAMHTYIYIRRPPSYIHCTYTPTCYEGITCEQHDRNITILQGNNKLQELLNIVRTKADTCRKRYDLQNNGSVIKGTYYSWEFKLVHLLKMAAQWNSSYLDTDGTEERVRCPYFRG